MLDDLSSSDSRVAFAGSVVVTWCNFVCLQELVDSVFQQLLQALLHRIQVTNWTEAIEIMIVFVFVLYSWGKVSVLNMQLNRCSIASVII